MANAGTSSSGGTQQPGQQNGAPATPPPATPLTQEQIAALNQQLANRKYMADQFRQAYLRATTPQAEAAAMHNFDNQRLLIQNLEAQLGATVTVVRPDLGSSGTANGALSTVAAGVRNVFDYFQVSKVSIPAAAAVHIAEDYAGKADAVLAPYVGRPGGNATGVWATIRGGIYNSLDYAGMVESNFVAQVDGFKSTVLDPPVVMLGYLAGLNLKPVSLRPLSMATLTDAEWNGMLNAGQWEGTAFNIYNLASAIRSMPATISSLATAGSSFLSAASTGAPALALAANGAATTGGAVGVIGIEWATVGTAVANATGVAGQGLAGALGLWQAFSTGNAGGGGAAQQNPLKAAMDRGMKTLSGKNAPDEMVEVLNNLGKPMSRENISEVIHHVKKRMNIGPAEDVVFDRSGGMWDSRTGEYIGKMWEGF